MNPKGGEIKPPWDGRRGGQGEGSIVFYKEQETSLKEYMKETLKQMQISKGGGEPLPSSPSCSAQGQPADLLLLAEGAPGGEGTRVPGAAVPFRGRAP